MNRPDQAISIELPDKQLMTMIYCPPGQFLMGTSDNNKYANTLEIPQHRITLSKGFWIGEAPITRQQYTLFMGTSDSLYESGNESPASQHTWNEAIEFCKTLNTNLIHLLYDLDGFNSHRQYEFTLPTEAQWEYACRANSTTDWYFGNDEHDLKDYAWFGDSTINIKLPPVKQRKPNPWGVYDLYGMVKEWCMDDFMLYKNIRTEIDPIGVRDTHTNKLINKIVRGGCIHDSASECRSSSRRDIDHWNSQNDITGIRLVINEP